MTWTVESVIACTVMPLLILACLVATAFLFRWWRHERAINFEPGLALACLLGGAAVTLIAAVGFWWGMYPWKTDYHSWQPKSGVVAAVDSRLLPAGDHGVEQKFVVQFRGDPTLYGVLDTRAASVRPGDTLSVSCVRRWQQTGTDGWDCAFTDLVKASAA